MFQTSHNKEITKKIKLAEEQAWPWTLTSTERAPTHLRPAHKRPLKTQWKVTQAIHTRQAPQTLNQGKPGAQRNSSWSEWKAEDSIWYRCGESITNVLGTSQNSGGSGQPTNPESSTTTGSYMIMSTTKYSTSWEEHLSPLGRTE